MPTIKKAGELVQHLAAAADPVNGHGLSPFSDIFVRDGPAGKLRRIQYVKAFQDERGTALVLELHPTAYVEG
jgi:hypothetical protein